MFLFQIKNYRPLKTAFSCLLVYFFSLNHGNAQLSFSENSFSPLMDSLLYTQKTFFEPYFKARDYYRIQVIYTQIDRDEHNIPTFTNHTWRLRPDEYFNPASFVKIPVSIFALEKINNELNQFGVTKFSRMLAEKNQGCQEPDAWDSTSLSPYPNIADYIKRALIVSENNPYKRLYEFLGQGYIQNKLEQIGFNDSKITQRFQSKCDEEGNRYTNAFNFYDTGGKLLYRQPEQYNDNYIHARDSSIVVGDYVMRKGKIEKGGKDFSNANRLQLHQLHQLMMAIFFPEQMPQNLQFNLSQEDLDLLRKSSGLNPEESENPFYNPKKYWPAYNNYFFYGQRKNAIINKDVRIFNKVAMSYGFLSETAYIVDFKTKREFFLSATIYTNKDGVISDDKYEYTGIGLPFMQKLSLLIYKYELQRKLRFEPDLLEFESLFQK
jgi:hypothetical protein